MLEGAGLGRGNTSERLIQLLCVYVKKHMFRSGTLGDLLFNSYLKPGQRLREGGEKKVTHKELGRISYLYPGKYFAPCLIFQTA